MTSDQRSRLHLRTIEETGTFDDEEALPATPPQAGADAASLKLLMFAITGLSQRALIALSNLFFVLTAFASLGLWYSVLQDSTVLKLIGASLCSGFVLALEYIREKP